MKPCALKFAVAIVSIFSATEWARCQTVNHIANPGMEHDVTDITGFMTTGSDMANMRVTAFFTSDLMGASESVNWASGGGGAGSAVGTGWRLDETGDTWNSIWRLSAAASPGSNLTIYGLLLEGFPETDEPVSERATLFDRTDPFFGTDGSYRGHDLEPTAMAGTAWSHVRVTYFDEIDNLADASPGPIKDVYRAMQLQFGNVVPMDPLPQFNPAPFMAGNELLFFQDTDTVGARVPGDPGEEGAPEPASIALVVIACAIAAGHRARTATSASH